MESLNFIKTGKLEELSEEETHDCCDGSWLLPEDAFTCIHNIGGLCSEANYPKQPDRKCHNSSCTPAVQVILLTMVVVTHLNGQLVVT